MRTLTININDSKSEKALLDFLDHMGLDYSVDLTENTYQWSADQQLVKELEYRSSALKTGKDQGLSFSEIKHSMAQYQ